jgi:catechol 2,3-dioxygenase-like lactoylglutathione lyase family enzyme
MSPVTGIHHVQLAMPAGAEAGADRFYAGVLGLRPTPKPPGLRARGGRWYAGAGFEIHLGVEEPFVPARKAHPAFLVEDLEHVRRALTAAGFEVEEDGRFEGFERLYTSDPFGNRVELIAPRPGRTAGPG